MTNDATDDSHATFNARLRESFEGGDLDRTATLFIQRYGQELQAFLVDRLRSQSAASEVFSQFAEDLWRGLPTFAWRASMRSWAYTLARNRAYQYRKSPHQQPRRNVTFGADSRFAVELTRLRSATLEHRKTEVKSRIRELRQKLSEEDQVLLVLRVDRELSFRELAVVLSDEGTDLDDDQVSRLATNLRQRFQKVKKRLRTLAAEEGLLPH